MERFSFLRPHDVQKAVEYLNMSTPGYLLAGGTDLMLLIRQDKTLTGSLIDITQISELHEINRRGDVVSVGAGATFNEILQNPLVNETAPLLCQAARQVGAAQIRNMGTIGGNVANAAACADSIPPLVCLDAVAVIRTIHNEVKIPVADFIVSPNKTSLPPGGMITSFEYQVPVSGARSVFLKLGRRNAMAISRLTVAALGCLNDDQIITEVRFVTGSATPRICRLDAVETSLIGKKPTADNMMAAARMAVDEMIRMAGKRWSSEFKMPALQAMTYRALTEIFIPGNSTEVHS